MVFRDHQASFGPHLTLDGKNCNIRKLSDFNFVYTLLDNLPSSLGMTKILPPVVVKFKDKWAKTEGVSGFVMIAESHISMHTFPDERYVFIDVFSCVPFDIEKVTNILKESFEMKDATINLVERGKDFSKNISHMPQMAVSSRKLLKQKF